MGFVDRYYYGQAKLIVHATTGSSITVTDGTRTWTGTSSSNVAEFLLPGTNKYSVSVADVSKNVYLSFGACALVSF